jgi:hypothetical protein
VNSKVLKVYSVVIIIIIINNNNNNNDEQMNDREEPKPHRRSEPLELLGCKRELCLEAVGAVAVVLNKLKERVVLMVALLLARVVLAILVRNLPWMGGESSSMPICKRKVAGKEEGAKKEVDGQTWLWKRRPLKQREMTKTFFSLVL